MAKEFVKCRFLRSHPKYSYFAGDTAVIDREKVEEMENKGYVTRVLPEPSGKDDAPKEKAK